MKRANNLFPKLVSEENLRLAIFAVNVTHRFHPHHRPNRTVARVEADIDRYVKELREIITGGYEANEPRLARRWDKSAGKWRDISEPRLWPDQYVHCLLYPSDAAGERSSGALRGRRIIKKKKNNQD